VHLQIEHLHLLDPGKAPQHRQETDCHDHH
jgi:hypothetical protein